MNYFFHLSTSTKTFLNMKNIVFILILLLTGASVLQAEVRFFQGDLESAKAEAAKQKKMVLVKFGADWCAPCRWMDKYTFTDKELSQYANSFYISVRVDVDEQQGYQDQQKYKVKLLPTILILSPDGKAVERKEHALPARELLGLLQKHNPRPTPNKAVALRTSNTEIPQAYDVTGKPMPGTGTGTGTAAGRSSKSLGLFQVDSELLGYEGYSVQVGAFSKEESVVSEVKRLEERMGKVDILLRTKVKNGKPLFLVLAGRFSNEGDAKAYLLRLKAKGVNGLVKKLSDLK
jgi:thiol-disulfide isomerase/thioredoxin